jgi:hypothetical protein
MSYTFLMDAQGTSRSRFFWRRVILAPACLLLVAGLQVVRVHQFGQSAWKGGGFGMFSTVDAPQARFLRLFVVTERGRVPVEAPAKLQKLISELRTAPSQRRAQELAAQLAKESWIDDEARMAAIAQRIDSRECAAPLTAAKLRNRRPTAAPLPACNTDGTRSSLQAAGSIDRRRERGDIVPVESIVVELWRYQYDAIKNELVARPWMMATVKTAASD